MGLGRVICLNNNKSARQVALMRLRAVIDAQELDASESTGSIYWEGLCELIDSNGKRVGRGYLEMTGYASPLKL